MVREVGYGPCNALAGMEGHNIPRLMVWRDNALDQRHQVVRVLNGRKEPRTIELHRHTDPSPPRSHPEGSKGQFGSRNIWEHDFDETLAREERYLARPHIDPDQKRLVNVSAR